MGVDRKGSRVQGCAAGACAPTGEGSSRVYQELMPEDALARYQRGEVVVLDVRTLPEWNAVHIPGARHIPIDELAARLGELDPEAPTLVVCAHGIRSAAAGQWLARHAEFEWVGNLRFGMSGWRGPVSRPGDQSSRSG